MTKHLPEWVMIRYSKLWFKFNSGEFSKAQAKKVVSGDKSLSVLLSELRKAGWLSMRMDDHDARKTIYKLKDPSVAIIEIIKELRKR